MKIFNLPKAYRPLLDLKQTELAIKQIKETFQNNLSSTLSLRQVTVMNLDVVAVDEELGIIAVRGAIPGPKGGVVFVKNTVKVHKVKQAGAGISNNPQKASARINPQKASARNM